MKRTAAILLCFCMLLQCMAQVAVVGLFELNKSYIAAELCENRAQPERNCCGKCYLGKQLNKVDDNQDPGGNAPVKMVKAEAMAYIVPAPLRYTTGAFAAPVEAIDTPLLNLLLDRIATASIFHPPAAC